MMDVAAQAGVSQATVSLVLNGSPGARLSDTTKERVRRAADALGYRLPRRQGGRPSSEARLVGFIADTVTTDPWMPLAFDGAREKALEAGMTVTLISAQGEEDFGEGIHDPLGQLPLHGLIYGTTLTRRVNPPRLLFDLPSVLLNCYDGRRSIPSVLPGDLVGGRVATERLIRGGCRRPALINGQDGVDASRDRLRGYRQALASNDLLFEPSLVWPGNWEPSAGYEGTRALMALEHPPDGIFCANDMMAVGCYDALKEMRLRIPQDISVIGFDDREIAQFLRPPLTTLVLPHYEMGEIAVEMLLDRAGGLRSRHDQVKVECPLLERASVAANVPA